MSNQKKHIQELEKEFSRLQKIYETNESELEKKDELLAINWETIQSMRLSNRIKHFLGIYKYKRSINYFKANPVGLKLNRKTKIKVCIKTAIPNWLKANTWGDFHFAIGVAAELRNLGYSVTIQTMEEWYATDQSFDVNIILRGPKKFITKKNELNLMWNISHPEEITPDEYQSYDHVFVASNQYANELTAILGGKVTPLLQCSDTNRFFPVQASGEGDLIFVGNSRGMLRPIVKDVISLGLNLKIFGADWEGLVSDKYIAGQHVDNSKLKELYSRPNIIFNDHWEDMRDYGFLSNRIFDVLACNGYLISDDIKGIPKDLEKFIYRYTSVHELETLIQQIRRDSDGNSAPKIAENHTFRQRSLEIHKVLNELIEEHKLAKTL